MHNRVYMIDYARLLNKRYKLLYVIEIFSSQQVDKEDWIHKVFKGDKFWVDEKSIDEHNGNLVI